MLKSRIKRFISSLVLEDLSKDITQKVHDEIMPLVKSEVSKISQNPTDVIEIRSGNTIKQIKGVTHEKFSTILQLVNLDIPVYLKGEAGTGKNVICKQIADSLGLDFYFTNAVTQEYKLTGFIDANGTYHETQFYKAFKNGGVFFLDELDASVPEVLVVLNAAIANRYFDFPTGKVEAHKDFRLIAAGNTLGTGSDNVYSGRYCLDGASMDRFSIVYVPYSSRIEEFITGKDKELVEFCHAYRSATRNIGITSMFSYRGLEAITKLKGTMPLQQILRICVTRGLGKDDISSLKSSISCSHNNEYFQAFSKL